MSNPKIQLRHDTAANWATENPVLLDGEIGIQKGGSTTPNFDDLSATSYTLNGTVISDFNVTQRDIGLSQLVNDNTQLTMKARIKIPTTAQNEWNCLYWLGGDNPDNCICNFILLYNNGWTLRLTTSRGDYWDNAEGAVPSNMIDTWVDVLATAKWNGNDNTIYRYVGIKLATDENYTQLSNLNHTNVTTVGTCSIPTRFFCKNDGQASWDIFRGEADLAECSITYGSDVLWTGLTTATTKLKIGDGETAWNSLPYFGE